MPRPPALCQGCGHRDVYDALNKVAAEYPGARIFGDIGCYTLGALPPFRAIDSCVDMGASITMAKGAADAGVFPAISVIGDSTFTHSGNYIYENEDGGNTDANGVTWYLMVDSETKFHIVGVKPYADAAPSLRIDEGQVVSVNGYTLDCNFSPYSSFTQYMQHSQNDEATTETVKVYFKGKQSTSTWTRPVTSSSRSS